MRLKLRASAMRKMRRSGNGVRVVAKVFGVSVRTVQREVKRKGRAHSPLLRVHLKVHPYVASIHAMTGKVL